jgi:beta-lactamase class A
LSVADRSALARAARAARAARGAAVAGLLWLTGCAAFGPAAQVVTADGRPPSAETAALARRVAVLARGFRGRVGIALGPVDGAWTVSYDGAALFPQQSVSKLCTAVAVLDAVDAGRLGLADPVLVRRADMSVFHQPIQAHLTDAGYATTVGELLAGAIAQSDNAADDILIRRLGGPAAVQAAIDARRLGALRCGPEERVLESKVAGVDWKPQYSFGQAFWTARDAVPTRVRRRLLRAYLADPDDGASPLALVALLRRLKRGELLSAPSTARLLQIMASTTTGPLRLPAGLGPGWSIAHKTGTGQDLADLATGNNDVGLLTAPDGRAYAVAVMIASTRQPVPKRQALMSGVASALVAADAASRARR